MKINHKIVATLVCTALLAALGLGVLFWSFRQIEKTSEVHNHTFMVMNKGDDFLSTLKDAETGQRGYLLTGDDIFLDPYLAARDNVSNMLKELHQLTRIKAAQKHLDAIAPLMDAKMAEMSQLITLRRSQNMTAITATVRGGHGKRLMDGIRIEMQSFMQIEEGAVRQQEAEFESKMHRMFSIIVISSLLTMLLALSFAYLLYRGFEQRRKNAVFLETEQLLKLQENANIQLNLMNVTLLENEKKMQRINDEMTKHQIEAGVQNAELRRTQVEYEAQQIELKQQNNKLRLSHEELVVAREYAENIVETVREPLVVLDYDLKIITANHSFYKTFIVKPEDTIGNYLYDLGNGQWNIPKLRLLVEEILPKDTVINSYEVEHDFPGIGCKTVVLNARQIFRENIGSHIILLAMEDITERKQMENELLSAHNKLESIINERTCELIKANEQKLELSESNLRLANASRTKSDFLANMSHELRTPLNSVIGFSEVLLDQLFGPLNDQQKEYTDNILSSGKHLLLMINDILDLAKVESGKMELELDTFSLRETLDASLLMFKERVLKAKIDLYLELGTQIDVEIVADQRKLKQIIFNLLSNAIKFTEAGGSVSVTARRVESQGPQNREDESTDYCCYLPPAPDGNFVEISVIDTGIGIKSEDISKLFDTFTQLESAYTKKHEGTGIGLVLSRQLVELHGGRIWLESELGVGSRFSFTIPLLQEGTTDSPAKRPDTACSKDTTSLGLKSEYDKQPEEIITMPRKILIVEDNVNNRCLFRDILSIHGYEVSEAIDGQDGVDQARKLMPDLILMDIQMPGMDGMTAGTILKGDPATGSLKIIALTSFAMQGDREKFLEAGFDGYLSKPINTRELPEMVKHWLDGEGPS